MNKILLPLPRVFHFSGGGTSANMVREYYREGDLVIFCDTRREWPETYRFIDAFERETGIPIVRLSGDWVQEVIVEEQMIPNRAMRKCTVKLKIKKARRYLWNKGIKEYVQFIGFRADEPDRVKGYRCRWKRVQTEFPLYTAGIDKPQVLLYGKRFPWWLNMPSIMGNCTGCFQKGEAALMVIYQHYPEAAAPWIEDEENREINPKGYTYFKGTTHRELRDKAQQLTKVYDLNEVAPKFSCSCTA